MIPAHNEKTYWPIQVTSREPDVPHGVKISSSSLEVFVCVVDLAVIVASQLPVRAGQEATHR